MNEFLYITFTVPFLNFEFLQFSGISSLCFTNYGEALYMMSSSELQRISLSATKGIRAEGHIEVDPLDETQLTDDEEDEDDDQKSETKSISTTGKDERIKNNAENLTNGVDTSPTNANVTITSSIGDITVDSVRDHLNSTVTTLHTTTTEEIVGKQQLDIQLLNVNYGWIMNLSNYSQADYQY